MMLFALFVYCLIMYQDNVLSTIKYNFILYSKLFNYMITHHLIILLLIKIVIFEKLNMKLLNTKRVILIYYSRLDKFNSIYNSFFYRS